MTGVQTCALPILTLFLLTVGLVYAAGETHQHKSPHGGVVRSAGDYHLELVRDEKGYKVYLLDAKEKTLPVTDLTGKATCLTKEKKKMEMELTAAGDHMVLATDPEALEGGTVIVAIRKGSESVSAKFTLGEHGHDEHGHDGQQRRH